MVALFVTTSFLTASLLFLVQPMVGRMVLPAFGGSPQVWTTSMLFFQAALLAGYGYTHLASTRVPRRAQPWTHLALALVPLVALPIALTVAPSGRGGLAPSFELLAGLLVGVAAPFVLVATSGPLVQRWFSWTDHPRAHDPYFLFAAGNVGSAAGLLSYPFVVEPALAVADQSRVWAGGYLLAASLLAACALVVARRPGGESAELRPRVASEPVDARRIGRWVLFAFVPSGLFLAVTSHLSTDIAAVPLLWVLPLTLYLLTFTVAFSRFGPVALRVARLAAPVVVVAAISLRASTLGVGTAVTVQLLLVAVGGLVGHGLLAEDRPSPTQLTRYYLWVAVGGACGGLFTGLIAPAVFPAIIEYGLLAAVVVALVVRWPEPVAGAERWPVAWRLAAGSAIGIVPVVALAVGHGVWAPDGWWPRFGLWAFLLVPLVGRFGRSGIVGASVALLALAPSAFAIAQADHIERTFFGIHRVNVEGDVFELVHGTTVHGSQDRSSPSARRTATTYFHPDGPFGDLAALGADADAIGVLGLGAGTIAAYGQPGQILVFHEIDPAVVDIAWSWFTYLEDSPADVEVVLGDGRLTLDGITGEYGLLVADAFTSDAVPVHLLTVEAISTYFDAVVDGGVVALNISNRYLDLRPVAAGAARELELAAMYRLGGGDVAASAPAGPFGGVTGGISSGTMSGSSISGPSSPSTPSEVSMSALRRSSAVARPFAPGVSVDAGSNPPSSDPQSSSTASRASSDACDFSSRARAAISQPSTPGLSGSVASSATLWPNADAASALSLAELGSEIGDTVATALATASCAGCGSPSSAAAPVVAASTTVDPSPILAARPSAASFAVRASNMGRLLGLGTDGFASDATACARSCPCGAGIPAVSASTSSGVGRGFAALASRSAALKATRSATSSSGASVPRPSSTASTVR
jgi:hypothetical protein